MKYLIILLILSSLLATCNEKPKNDKDFIISFLTKAKTSDINGLKKYLSFNLVPKEDLLRQVVFLLSEIKDAEIPQKDSIKNIINNGEYQCYRFKLEPMHTIYQIDIINNNNDRKIDILSHIPVFKLIP